MRFDLFIIWGNGLNYTPEIISEIREDKNYKPYKNLIESAVITYLKETNQYENLLNEEGEVLTFEPEQEVFCNCFGIDVYEIDDKLISEKEYAKTL